MTKKTFDAVRMMREIRDQLSRDMEKMTPDERITYIRDKARLCGIGEEPRQKNEDGRKGAIERG